MGIDLKVRVQLLKFAIVRRTEELAIPKERRRFATNMALVYRVPEMHVLALIEDTLGLRTPPLQPHPHPLSSRPTPRLPSFDELAAARGQGSGS